MNIKKRLIAALTLMAMATGVAVVQATPAHAAWEGCPNYAVCIADGSNGGLNIYYWTQQSWSGCIRVQGWWNDRAGSVWNRTPSSVASVRFFEHDWCASDGNPEPLFTYNGQMKSFGTGSGLTQYNNMISSIIVVGVG